MWAGKPVNMAAKLSSLAEANEMAVSDRVFAVYEHASRLRQRALTRIRLLSTLARPGGQPL